MKTSYTCILVLIMFLLVEANAQDQPLKGFSISQYKTEVKDDNLYVDFDININRLNITSNQGIVLTPVLQSPSVTKVLPKVIINRRNRNISYSRTINSKLVSEPYAVIKINKKSQTVISYNVKVPFEEWMQNSTLILQQETYCCGGVSCNMTSQVLPLNVEVSPVTSPILTYLSPMTESSESTRDSVSSILLFPESETTILPEYAQNSLNIARTDSVLRNKNIIVTDVHIVGAASPEGLYQFNEQLSEKRARALSSFFKSRYNILPELYKMSWVGEDWKCLLKMVEQSDMRYKQEVLAIIRNVGIFSGREYDLMNLMSGEPYQYMQEHYFPQLRRVVYTIHYITVPFNLIKGRELMLSDSQLLSVNEMLLVADSYPKGSEEYKNMLEIAVRTYPDNIIANVNASSLALSTGNTVVAKQYLERFEQQPESWNNIGIIYLLDGNYEEASRYFQKAIDSGSVDAVGNMRDLNNKRNIP